MKHADIKNCEICDKGLMHAGNPLFIRVQVERMGFDKRAIEKARGMELMMGNHILANIMGANEDLAKVIDTAEDILICSECLEKPLPPYFWLRNEK